MIWNFEQFKNRVAIRNETGEEYSYSQLSKIAKNIASRIPRRSLVLCLCQNSPGSVIGYLSFINNGIVPMLIDATSSNENIIKQINKWRPMYLWGPDKLILQFRFPVVFCSNGYQLLQTNKKDPWPLNSELSLLLNTSGSTGSTKLIKLSYQNIKSNILQIVSSLSIVSDDITISSLPMYYSYGLSIIHTYIFKGACIVLTNKSPVAPAFWALVKHYKVTSLSGVPFHYNLYNKIDLESDDFDTLRVFTQAGGAISPKIHKQFAHKTLEHKRKFYAMYGQTEATARMSVLPQELACDKVGSIGIPVPGSKIELIDDNGEKIDKTYTNGELIYYGENVFMGYAKKGADLLSGDKNKGALKTGDLGYKDKDGYFYITGRKSRFVKIHGIRVGFDEVENILNSRFPDFEFVCIGEEEKLKINFTGEIDDEIIKSFILEQTRLHSSTVIVQKLKELPRNKSGKIMYDQLNKMNGEPC